MYRLFSPEPRAANIDLRMSLTDRSAKRTYRETDSRGGQDLPEASLLAGLSLSLLAPTLWG